MNHELDYSYEGASIESGSTSEDTANLEDRASRGTCNDALRFLSWILSLLGVVFIKKTKRLPI